MEVPKCNTPQNKDNLIRHSIVLSYWLYLKKWKKYNISKSIFLSFFWVPFFSLETNNLPCCIFSVSSFFDDAQKMNPEYR